MRLSRTIIRSLRLTGIVFATMIVTGVPGAWAAAPTIQTPAPVIHLADNLDEADRLGWCIDTVGRGFSDRLHAHSCKPAERRHGDVQFRHDSNTRQILSATYDGKCAELLGAAAAGTKLGLVDCNGDSDRQKFHFHGTTGEFRVESNKELCLVVAPTSRTAGPFMSRDLLLGRCASIGEKFKRWVIRAGT